ncbi:MAG: efflux RND transporter permease subunit [Planctomycetes bacterium]|nr:efflux RND transporter permease subunit [Planctomycetota bacterium]
MNITEVCIRKPVLAWMIMGATIVFGLVAAMRIGVSQFPDVDFPTISVSLNWPGASPDVVESDLIQPVEEALVQVEGIRSITSTARQGSANITVELDLSRNVDVALQDVQTKVAGAQRRLPKDVEPPSVSKTNPEDNPIMWLGLAGPFSRQVLSDYARYRVKDRLQTLPGVGEINFGGLLERNIRIWADADALDERGITVTDVINALRRQHVELPAGQLQTVGREVNVRVMGEALDLETLRGIVVKETPGKPVYLSDVALVEDGFEDVRRLARFNGAPAQGLGIRKQRGANAVAVAKAVRAELEEIRKTLPQDMELAVNFDSTPFIEESVHEIEFELIIAVILTALVCWLFLGSLSSTLNVILAIPMSLLGTIAAIYFLGFTLNTFTLLALSLSVGIVVDDAIMVMENIFRHGEMGKRRELAALEGTQEIKFAALAATAAVIAIFLPVIFMKGIVGKFFLQFGITLSIAVAISYVEAITLAPARCAKLLNTSRHDRSAIGRAVDNVFEGITRVYRRVLNVGLKMPILVLLVGAGLFASAIYVMTKLPGEFVPSQDQSRLMVRITTAVGSDINETDSLFQKCEAIVNNHPLIQRAFVSVGGFGGAGVNSGVMFLTLVPKEERDKTQGQVAGEIRGALNAIPGVRAVVQDLSQQGFTAQRGFPIEFSLRGPDWDQLVETSLKVREKLAESGMAVDIDTDYVVGMPELRVAPNRARVSDIGISVEDVASTLNALVGGINVGRFNSNGRRVDVRLRLLAGQRSRPEDIAKLRVRGPEDSMIPLSALVARDERPALQSIIRRDRERAVSIFANVAPGKSQSDALAFVQTLRADMPEGVALVFGGASVAFQESMESLIFALILGIIVAYMVLGAQFNSFLHPITVLTILPLSVAGAAFALLIAGKTLNIFSMIGLLLLMGIVKKNSIILVDYATQLRAKGLTAREAMSEAGPVRLRPILMTSMATFMAAVPAALALGAGGEVRQPMAMSVIGGLILSTGLSLLVVPAFYVTADSIKGFFGRLWPRKDDQDGHGHDGPADHPSDGELALVRRDTVKVSNGTLPPHETPPPELKPEA